jgi:hypothetical protein
MPRILNRLKPLTVHRAKMPGRDAAELREQLSTGGDPTRERSGCIDLCPVDLVDPLLLALRASGL